MTRDNFNTVTKRTMAERVAWCCSWPSCSIITVGPSSSNPEKSINNGIAAHIQAASPDGPRYNPSMSAQERKHITNGIWMCRHHGNLIDADYTEYSTDSLRKWKYEAERKSAENLKIPNLVIPDGSSTLVAIGFDLILSCRWIEVNKSVWKFEVLNFIKGDIVRLRDISSNFTEVLSVEKFVIVESQGDARILGENLIFTNENGRPYITFEVLKKFQSTDPEKLGTDIALDDAGDLLMVGNVVRKVDGIKNAIQKLSTTMGIIRGEWFLDKNAGSFISEYYRDYRHDIGLFSKLVKLEFIRLSLVPDLRKNLNKNSSPPLHFVKRINEVTVLSLVPKNNRISIKVNLEWGNATTWVGTIDLFIGDVTQFEARD